MPSTQAFGSLSDDEAEEFTNILVYGLDCDEVIDGVAVVAHMPLSILLAAKFMGLRTKRARTAFQVPAVRKLFGQKLEALRNGERARNIATAISIRDALGDGTAADQSVRLKAIATLEGNSAGGVTVNLNSTTNVDARQITPGYVIRLPAKADSLSPVNAPRALPGSLTGSMPPMIEGVAVDGVTGQE